MRFARRARKPLRTYLEVPWPLVCLIVAKVPMTTLKMLNYLKRHSVPASSAQTIHAKSD